jgi:hypothetical protein
MQSYKRTKQLLVTMGAGRSNGSNQLISIYDRICKKKDQG